MIPTYTWPNVPPEILACPLWGQEDQEELTSEFLAEEIDRILDTRDEEAIPEQIEVFAYRPAVLDPKDPYLDPGRIVEGILESLDCNYEVPWTSDPKNTATDKMLEAAAALVAVIRADYHPAICYEVAKVIVPMKAFNAEEGHNPHV